MQMNLQDTVKPVLSGTVISGHPFLSGHLVKSRKFHNVNTIAIYDK